MKFLILIGLFIFGCGGSDSATTGFQELESPNVTVNLSLVDVEGNPVSGANIKMRYDLDMTPGQYRPNTVFELSLPQASNTNVSLYDLEGNVVSTLKDTLMNSGYHQFSVPITSDDIALHAPLGLQVFRYTATTDSESLSNYMTLIYGIDTSQIPSIGTTDNSGTLTINKSQWFPHLYDLPEMQMTDSNNNALGTFYVTDYIENSNIIIVVEYENESKSYNTNIVSGNNNIELVWDLTNRSSIVVNNYDSDMELLQPYSLDIDTGILPTDLSLSQNYPNPFN